MAKLKDKTEVGGLFGESVTLTKVNGRVVAKNRPKRSGKKRKLTENEITQHERFKQASRYASVVQNDKELNALYAKRKRNKYESAYTVALADFHNAPKIHAVAIKESEVADNDEICVEASDDFMVIRVTVEIFSSDGSLIEKGDATQNQARHFDGWFYIPTVAQPMQPGMKIRAAAFDRPANKTVMEIVCE